LIRYNLKHDHERQEIALKGYDYVHTYHSYDMMIDEIISCMESGLYTS